MPRFITIGYGDQAGYDRTPENIRNAAHEHDARLVEAGAVIGVAGKPVQVRNANARDIETENGPYLSSDLPIAGFGLIEAENLDAAIRLAARSPCAVAHGVIEVWPLTEPPAA